MTEETRAVSAVRPITLLEDIEVPELGWGAASIVGAGERRRRGRVSCDERRGRMESQVRFCGRAGAAGFLPVCRDARLVRCRLRQGHPSTIYQYEDLPEGPTEKEVRQLVQSVKGSGQAALRTRSHMQRQMVSWTQLSYCT